MQELQEGLMRGMRTELDTRLGDLDSWKKNIDSQLGHLAAQIPRPQGQLPGRPEENPRGRASNGEIRAMNLRSGKALPDPPKQPAREAASGSTPPGSISTPSMVDLETANDEEEGAIDPAEVKLDHSTPGTSSNPSPPLIPDPTPSSSHSKILPYPSKKPKDATEGKFKRFVKLLQGLNLSIPFAEALNEMPAYTKFLKEILSRKRSMSELTDEVRSLDLPEKLGDPGKFAITIGIGAYRFKALCDLGASASLLPLSIWSKTNMGPLVPMNMRLYMADGSCVQPTGVVDDFPVQVGKFFVPNDFIVMEMPEDPVVPIILGRPFLATAGAVIDVKSGLLTFKIGEEVVEFRFNPTLKESSHEEVKMLYTHSDYIECNNPTGRLLTWEPLPPSSRLSGSTPIGSKSTSLDDGEESILALDALKAEHEDEVSLPEPTPELKELPDSLRYAFLGPNSSLPVIINANLSEDEENKLLDVLRTHRKAIGYSLEELSGISPSLCMHRIYMEDDYKPTIEHQRRLNPNMKEVVKKEILRMLDAGIIFPISDSKWVSPVHVVPKKGGMTVVENEKGELIPTRTTTKWRMCIDYRKLNSATRKDHFPLPFIDQVLESLAQHDYFCYLDGYSGFWQIPIHPDDQEKTTFTCPYGTFAYKRMPFGLCNAPATFQRCMMAIFSDMIEEIVEVFMDDFSVYGSSFDSCLVNLSRVLKRCEETNLVLNWEKCHFMVREGIVLGHLVSKRGIEVDKAKIELIEKLPPPSSVKDVRSFLGHAGFYRHFIQDFSKIAKPLTHLLVKDVEFSMSSDCLEAFFRLRRALVTAPIMQSPDWTLPFEIMCDASDYAIGAVLGQRKDKKLHAIYYASKTLDEAQSKYTTTEKEFLAVVFAFEKFRSYLVGSKVIVYTDHAAIRFLMAKKDAKPIVGSLVLRDVLYFSKGVLRLGVPTRSKGVLE